jgi:DNA polymerase
MPTFHPAYILRNYTLETRRKVWSDMQAVLQKLAELREKSASIA